MDAYLIYRIIDRLDLFPISLLHNHLALRDLGMDFFESHLVSHILNIYQSFQNKPTISILIK